MMLDDFKNSLGIWAKGAGNVKTRSGRVWCNMSQRCKPDGPYQQRNPSYGGCEMSILFKDFQGFTGWYTKQIGYGCENYDLDKDILIVGNKMYSEENCVLLPHTLNCFFRSTRGLMAGVFFDKRRGTIYSKIVTSEGQKRLGTFSSISEAAAAYRHAKIKEACRWADRISSGEYRVDKRVIAKLTDWQF